MYEHQQVREISVDDLKNMTQRREKAYMIADARDIGDFIKGHIPGACSLFDAEVVSMARERLDKSARIIVYEPGQAQPSPPADRLAVDAARKLMDLGFRNVMVLKGGLLAWAGAGNRLDRSEPKSLKPADVPLF